MRAPVAFDHLSAALDGWVQRLRLQRASAWALRGLNLGLALALVGGGAGLLRAQLLRSQFLLVVLSLGLLTPVLAGIIAYLWPVRRMQAARRLDRMLGLRERVSTALQFDEAQRAANPILAQQLEDAADAASHVKPDRALRVRFRPLEALPALVLLLLIGLMWVRGEAWFQAAQRAAAVRQAVAQQQQSIEQILTQVQNSSQLTDQQKKALSQPLQSALQGLQDNPSLESSVSVLTSSAEQLQALSSPNAQQLGQALQQAGSQLASQNGSPLQSLGQSLANGDIVSAASQLKQLDVSKLSAADKQQLASQLQSLAQALQSTNPGLASQLQQAAQALHNGDTAAAQQALSEAAKSMAQAGQQVTFSQVAGQAQQALQQGAGQIIAAGGGQQQAQGQANNGQGQQGSSQGGSSSGQGASGSGQGSGQGTQGQEAPNTPIDQNNGPGNGGESTYEQIYAPSLLGGPNGQTVTLPGADQPGEVIGQGPAMPGQQGESLVPYQQVLGQYEQVNQQAIDNGSIPVEFMQIIHNYFDSIKP